VFGTGLGDVDLFEALATVDDSISGEVRLIVSSLLDEAFLSANQPDSLVLATLEFHGLQIGVTPVGLSVVELTDAGATPFDAPATGADVEYVPEPAPVLLILAGLSMLACGWLTRTATERRRSR
jgi:hypothetical protein